MLFKGAFQSTFFSSQNLRSERIFFENIQKIIKPTVKKNQNFDCFEGHTNLRRKIDAATQAVKLPTTLFFDFTLNLRFGRAVFEKNQLVPKKYK